MSVLSFEVAGALYYRRNEVFSLLKETADWKKSPAQLLAEGKAGKYIYRYRIFEDSAQLVREPTNEHNHNAVMIVVHGVQIGYVPESMLDAVRLLMKKDPSLSVTVKIYGGERKQVLEDNVVYLSDVELRCDAEIEYTESIRVNSSTHSYSKRKNKWITFCLCLFLGFFGAHYFYEGNIKRGILYLFTVGLFGIGWIADIFKTLFKPKFYYV